VAFVLAGGIDTLNVQKLPASFHGAVLVRFLLHPSEIETPHKLEIRFVDADGRILVKLGGDISGVPSPDMPVGWFYPVMASVTIVNMQLPNAGTYACEILGDGTYMTTLNFRVKVVPPIPPA